MTHIRLVTRHGPGAGQMIELPQKPIVSIGRSKDNDFQIDDPKISRHHARLVRRETGYVLEDLNSTNGTFVNNQRISAPAAIQPGDVIGFGDNVLIDVQAVTEASQTTTSSYGPPTPLPSPSRVYPPPPPTPVALEPERLPGHTRRNIAIGCGIALAILACVLVTGFLVYQFAPPSIATPICNVLRALPLLGALCQ